MDKAVLSEALALVENVTPLKTDCGLICSAACCKDNGEAGSCVWLLPGEEEVEMPWASKFDTEMPLSKTKVKAIYCNSPCARGRRPFMCRIFPLTPYYSEKKRAWSVRLDRRAAAVCPLYEYGKRGLQSEFVYACESAVRKLAEDNEYKSFLKALEAEESAFRFEL